MRIHIHKLDHNNIASLLCPTERTLALPPCNENLLMIRLAKLKLTGPERILQLLVRSQDLNEMCTELRSTMSGVHTDYRQCIPLATDNLFANLFRGIEQMYTLFCGADMALLDSMDMYHSCMQEIHNEYVECEGPADWIERDNATQLCQ